MNTGYTEQLLQIFNGTIWDGNLISKTDRDQLVKKGYVDRLNGWNFITKEGVRIVTDLGLIDNRQEQ